MSSEVSPTPAEVMPSMQLLADLAQEQHKLPEKPSHTDEDLDDGSSALSDLEDRGTDAMEEKPSSDLEDLEDEEEEEEPDEGEREDAEGHVEDEDEDTEAETERIDESPQKLPSQRSIHHGAGEDLSRHGEVLDEDSEISSIASVGESEEHSASQESTPDRKRKREDDASDEDDEDEMRHSMKRVARELEDHVRSDEEMLTTADHIEIADEAGDVVNAEDEDESEGDQFAKENEDESKAETRGPSKPDADAESVTEEAGVEHEDEVGSVAQAETAARNEEELNKKKAALDLLSGIEKDFALFRDRLFAEKTRQLNEELASLDMPNTRHPEYLTVLAAIDQRRADNIHLARISLKYKAETVRVKSLAERSQAHGQYMQDAREARDCAIERAGIEFYRIQRERRRNLEDDEREKIRHFNPNRTALITQQTMYNAEVSILSGIQKYVGFPAAPELIGTSKEETDDDLKRMGIALRLSLTRPTEMDTGRFQILKQPNNLPTAVPNSQFPRQRYAAEEQFFEQTPWANPQHPYHQQMAGHLSHQQLGNGSSYVTPAPPRRRTEAHDGSASTIAISSHGPTPLSNDMQAVDQQRVPNMGDSQGSTETPSRVHNGQDHPRLPGHDRMTNGYLLHSALQQPSSSPVKLPG